MKSALYSVKKDKSELKPLCCCELPDLGNISQEFQHSKVCVMLFELRVTKVSLNN
jgi:hypothetical protein